MFNIRYNGARDRAGRGGWKYRDIAQEVGIWKGLLTSEKCFAKFTSMPVNFSIMSKANLFG